jgi:hypothetical protein
MEWKYIGNVRGVIVRRTFMVENGGGVKFSQSPIWAPEWSSDNALAQVHELLIRCYVWIDLKKLNSIRPI